MTGRARPVLRDVCLVKRVGPATPLLMAGFALLINAHDSITRDAFMKTILHDLFELRIR